MTRLKPTSLTRRLQSRLSQNAVISARKSVKTRNSSHDSPSHRQHLVKSGQHDFSAEIGPGLRSLSRHEKAVREPEKGRCCSFSALNWQ